MDSDLFLQTCIFLLTVIQIKIAFEQLGRIKQIEKSVSDVEKISNDMELATEARDILRLLKVKYPDIDFGVKFE